MSTSDGDEVPDFLAGYEDTYAEDPREATREWFRDAKYGLFLHYGLYSILGNHEWVQYDEEIPPAEYALLQDGFTAADFDAEAIVAFAQDAGMEYVNLTTKHHDGFCLFDSAETTYTSADAPCGRDLVGELAAACDEAGLGFFCYYSIGVDWHHPHAPNREDWGGPARPDYDERPGIYADAGHDLDRYLAYVDAQVEELLSNYGPIAGVWFDPAVFSTLPGKRGWDPEPFDLESRYEVVREGQPHTLVSYKDGVTGTEDFIAPERYYDEVGKQTEKQGEVCACMLPAAEYEEEIRHSWGYYKPAEGKHLPEAEVWELLEETRGAGHNLLLNTGPLPEGGLDPEDTEVLRAVGERIEAEGVPEERE
jgi:alpha-L-fucosidase